MFSIRKAIRKFDRGYFRRVPLRTWLRSCYLTARYVDEWEVFPAIQFKGIFPAKIVKHRSARLTVKGILIFERWINGSGSSVLTLMEGARIETHGDFIIGDGIKILLSPRATLVLKGRKEQSGSGITANSVILVNKYVEIGFDCIVAWDTFITDCDWHSVDGQLKCAPTILENHVWVGVGVKILKGVTVGENCIVTANTVLVGKSYPAGQLISGIPGEVKRAAGTWSRDGKNTLNHI
jgi:hypothetical protein